MEFGKKIKSTNCLQNCATVRPISTYAASQGWYSTNCTRASINTITNTTTSTINTNHTQKMMNLPPKPNAASGCRVNVVELPEIVVMETMFINTHRIGRNKLNNASNIYDSNRTLLQSEVSISSSNSNIDCTSSAINSQAKIVDIKFTGGNIISPLLALQPQQLQYRNPIRIPTQHSSQLKLKQTETHQKQAIGIQCNLYEGHATRDENCFGNISEEAETPLKLDEDERKESFIRFVNENAIDYCHQLYECKICGEAVKGSIGKLCAHMCTHWSPKVLCTKCGEFVENRGLLDEHENCIRYRKFWGGRLHCPYYLCNVVAISPLELYDHINEHIRIMEYKCTACCKGFCTAGEFLRHLLLNANCYTKSKRTRRLYGLTSSTSKHNLRYRLRVFALHTKNSKRIFVKARLSHRRTIVNVCQLCLKRFLNKKLFQNHVKRCLISYKLRFLL